MANFLLNLLANSFSEVGETMAVAALQELHDNDRPQYLNAIRGGKAFVGAMRSPIAKSKTKIDDAILNSISEAIEESAAANGIDLNEDDDL